MYLEAGAGRLELLAPAGFPLVRDGDPLWPLIQQTLDANGLSLRSGDVLVLAQKIVSKSERRYRRLADVAVSGRAREIAGQCRKDPRLVELILAESERIVRCAPGVLIVRHRLGFVHANAGIDHSNIEDGDAQVLLLPENPDESAARLRALIVQRVGADVGVIINDSSGRPWRLGTCGLALGSAGVQPLQDLRGAADLSGRELQVTEVAWIDEIAAAASLLMGAAAEGRPMVIVRGLSVAGTGGAGDLIRPLEQDLFL